MEEKPWLKSEFFAWHDGRRIVDLYELSKQLQCKQCRSLLDLRRTEREARYGLASVLYIACHCGVMNDVHTGRKQESGSDMANGGGGGNMYEINIKASINLLMYGVGASRFLSFLALLDIPVPPPDDTSLIVPVTDDAYAQRSGPGAPSSSNVPQNQMTPAFNSSAFGAPQPGFNIPSSGYGMPPPPHSSVPPGAPMPYQQPGSSSFMPGGAMPSGGMDSLQQVSGSFTSSQTPGGNTQQNSGGSQELMYVTPLDDDSEEEDREKTLTRPVPGKAELMAKRGQTAKRGRVKGKSSRKSPSATETSASMKKKRREGSDGDFVNPMEWPSSDESESDGKNSDVSWRESDGENDDDGKDKNKQEKSKDDDEEDDGVKESDLEEKKKEKAAKRKRVRSRKSGGKKKKGRLERKQDEADNAPKCPDCHKVFSSIKGYNNHMKRVHDKEVKETEEPLQELMYVCSICNQPFTQATSLYLHMLLEHKTAASESGLEVPMGTAVSRCTQDSVPMVYYKCCKCGRHLRSRRAVAAHIRISPDKAVSCKRKCPDGAVMNRNQRRQFRLYSSATGGLQNAVLCPDCGLAFLNKSAFRKHRESQHDEKDEEGKEFLCCDCGAKFHKSSGLAQHRRYVHSEKQFVCEVCSFATAYPKTFIRHHLTHNKSTLCPRPFTCDTCGKTFTDRAGLTAHRRNHQPRRHKCSICSKAFKKGAHLRRHVAGHSGVHPFFCEDCGQSFTREYNLMVHRRLHTGEKPYRCGVCSAAFAQRNSLNVHMKKHTS